MFNLLLTSARPPWPFFVMSLPFTFFSSLLRSARAPATPLPLQACKPNHNAEGEGQSLPPHAGPLGQAEDPTCPAKRRRASSPSKVNDHRGDIIHLLPPCCNGDRHAGQSELGPLVRPCAPYMSCVFFRLIHGSVTHHSSQFPTGTSPRRNYRLVLSSVSFDFMAKCFFFVQTLYLLSVVKALEQLRSNRASLKPPQLQMLGQLEAQFAMMQQHQHQVQQNRLYRRACRSSKNYFTSKPVCRATIVPSRYKTKEDNVVVQTNRLIRRENVSVGDAPDTDSRVDKRSFPSPFLDETERLGSPGAPLAPQRPLHQRRRHQLPPLPQPPPHPAPPGAPPAPLPAAAAGQRARGLRATRTLGRPARGQQSQQQ